MLERATTAPNPVPVAALLPVAMASNPRESGIDPSDVLEITADVVTSGLDLADVGGALADAGGSLVEGALHVLAEIFSAIIS